MRKIVRFIINLLAGMFLIWLYGCGAEEAEVSVEQAEAGPQGEEGQAGSDGKDGVTTVQEVPVEVPDDINMWEDPVTGLVWLIGSDGVWSEVATACSGKFRSATQAELQLAGHHGLFVVSMNMGGPDSAWSGYDTAGGGLLVRLAATQVIYDTQNKNSLHGIFCIEK